MGWELREDARGINRHCTRRGFLRFLISAHLWKETLLCTVVVVVVVV
jgi:hypothetical protein